MCILRTVFYVSLVLSGLNAAFGSEDVVRHHSGHGSQHVKRKGLRKHRATNASNVTAAHVPLHFEPEPYNKKLELNSSGKIHCKVAGGVAPTVQWFLNSQDPLPEGVSSANGTLIVSEASRRHAGQYTCRATDGDAVIAAEITLDIVVMPKVLEPAPGERVHVTQGRDVALRCRVLGDPPPTTHWDRNITILNPQQDGVDVEDGVNASTARMVLLKNGTLLIRGVRAEDADRYGCTAGSAAGLARNELLLIVHPEGESGAEGGGGVAGKAVVVSVSVAGAYMLLVLALMLYCRRRRARLRQRGEKMELEMAEGREKLVEEGEEEKPKSNGAPLQNGKLLPPERDSGADNSEVSGISRASKKSGQFEHLAVPRALLIDQVTLGRGEFGDVTLAKIDMAQVKRLRGAASVSAPASAATPRLRPVIVKALTTKDENQLAEFRRQLELFGRVRHEGLARLVALCTDAAPHLAVLEHTDWGDLKSFLIATRTPEEAAAAAALGGSAGGAAGGAAAGAAGGAGAVALAPSHCAALAAQLAAAAAALASKRITHRDIAARNCAVSSRLQLKLTCAALSRGPDSRDYYKLHDRVIPLRWLPAEAALEADYSAKSDAYMFAATVFEIYTKAELPFVKLNDNSVLERLKSGTLEWTPPGAMPDALADLLKRCWSKSPADRPQFDDICAEINSIVKDITSENVSQKSQENP